MVRTLFKLASRLLLIVFLFSMFVIASKIQPAKSQNLPAIYIMPDGSINPPTAPIFTTDNVTYTLTNDVNASIVVERDYIAIDGAGYTIQGEQTRTGINLEMRSNVTLRNLNLKGFQYCIWQYQCFGTTILRNNITDNLCAINLYNCSYNDISENNISENSAWGILISSYSRNCVLRNNTLTNNRLALVLNGITQLGSLQIDDSNTINGKRIYYWVGIQNKTVPLDAGFVALVDCSDIRVENLTLVNNGYGILLSKTYNCTIRGNNITSDEVGIEIEGIWSFNNTISGNRITNNYIGVYLDYYAHPNRIFYNDFINNTEQAVDGGSGPFNAWDNGVEGNYWSNYAGNDSNNDGIGDIPYMNETTIIDRYPLIAPYNPLTRYYSFYVGEWGAVPYFVEIASNSTVSNLSFDEVAETISFTVSVGSPTTGYCRIVFKNALLDNPYTAWINTTEVTPIIVRDETQSFLYFTYPRNNYNVRIIGTKAIPEFQSLLLLPLFMIATLLVVIFYKRKPHLKESRALIGTYKHQRIIVSTCGSPSRNQTRTRCFSGRVVTAVSVEKHVETRLRLLILLPTVGII